VSDAFLIIVDGSTQVGFFLPALVTHEEVEIWAGAEEVEEKTQDPDDWEIAERKATRKAKIVAVPLAYFSTSARFIFVVIISANQMILECFGHHELLSLSLYILVITTCIIVLKLVPFAHMLRLSIFTRVIHTCVCALVDVYILAFFAHSFGKPHCYILNIFKYVIVFCMTLFHSCSICTHAVYVCTCHCKHFCVCTCGCTCICDVGEFVFVTMYFSMSAPPCTKVD